MRIYIISFVIVGLLVGGVLFAQDTDTQDIEETVTIEDLGIADVGILPTSPFYFFKEFGRGVQSFFTFNSVAKAELELRFTNEKAAEAKKVEELRPNDESAIARALQNYQKTQERLAIRLERLSETSENPNIDRLFDKVAERTILHEKLFEEIELKFKGKLEIRNGVARIKERIEVTIVRIAEKDEPEKFKIRLKAVFEGLKGGTLKHVRSIEFLDRIESIIPEEKRESLSELREVLASRLAERLEQEVDEQGVERLKEKIKRISGGDINRTVLLEEFRVRASDKLARALRDTQEDLERDEEQGEELKKRAQEQIERAGSIIAKLRKETEEKTASQVLKSLLDEAEKHLVAAKEAFENENYGNAFGQARAALATARNALSILSRGDVPTEAIRILDKVRTQLRESIVPAPSSLNGTQPRGVVCTQEYKPVCGVDGETFSNECFAKASGMKIAYRGVCKTDRTEEKEPSSIIDDVRTRLIEPLQPQLSEPQSTTPAPSDLEEVEVKIRLEADDSSFYPSSEVRVAKGSRVKLTFAVRENNVYFGGLDFRSSKFKTSSVKPGQSTTVEFVADESFEFTSWWPASDRLKVTGRVVVE